MKQKDYKGNCLIYSDKEAFEMQQNMKMRSNLVFTFQIIWAMAQSPVH